MNARTPIAVALAALLAAPAVASAQVKRSTRAPAPHPTATTTSTADGLSVDGFVGFETGDLTGFALRVDGEMPFQQLSPQVKLSFVGSLGYTHFGKDVTYGSMTYNIVKLVPAARFTLPVNPQFDFYGDAGLGVYYYSLTAKTTYPGLPTLEASSSGVSMMMRFGAGAFYRVNPKLRIGAELGILPYFGKANTTDFSIMAGAMFAI